MNTFRRVVVISISALAGFGCGVDRIQHIELRDAGASMDASVLVDSGSELDAGFDAGTVDAGYDAGFDAGSNEDAGFDAGSNEDAGFDAGTDAGSTSEDAGTDAGTCTQSGVSPELMAVPGGPYQNCQGGQIPRTDYQQNTTMWSGCCGELVRVCQVSGFSTQNVLYCR